MKKLKLRLVLSIAIVLTALAVPVTQTGCATAERNAYRTAGVAQISADVAMAAWRAYVVSGKASTIQEVQVKKAFDAYTLAALAVIHAGRAAGENANTPAIAQALAMASASLVDLVNLVQSFGVKL